MARPVSELIEEQAAAWSAVKPPNAAGISMAEGLAGVIAGYEAIRGMLAFEDEPSSFEAALQATKEAC